VSILVTSSEGLCNEKMKPTIFTATFFRLVTSKFLCFLEFVFVLPLQLALALSGGYAVKTRLFSFVSVDYCSPEIFIELSIRMIISYDLLLLLLLFHVGWIPCHHGMARPQVADRGKFSGHRG
jgi:hypothetical protein